MFYLINFFDFCKNVLKFGYFESLQLDTQPFLMTHLMAIICQQGFKYWIYSYLNCRPL